MEVSQSETGPHLETAVKYLQVPRSSGRTLADRLANNRFSPVAAVTQGEVRQSLNTPASENSPIPEHQASQNLTEDQLRLCLGHLCLISTALACKASRSSPCFASYTCSQTQSFQHQLLFAVKHKFVFMSDRYPEEDVRLEIFSIPFAMAYSLCILEPPNAKTRV